jgi:hypothetical protein
MLRGTRVRVAAGAVACTAAAVLLGAGPAGAAALGDGSTPAVMAATVRPAGPVTVTEVPVAITAPAAGAVIASQQPAITGTGTSGAVVTLTDQSGNLIGQAAVAGDGTWTVTPAAPLPLGPVTITAAQAINGIDTTTDSVSFTVTGAPVAITGPAPGGSTSSQRPLITGTGTPGATVTFTDQSGTTIGQATVAGDGTWAVIPAAPLPLGPVTITATQVINGVTSDDTDSFSVTVTAALVDITAPASGSTVASQQPAIAGTGTPGATVTLTDQSGNSIGQATVAGDGTWAVIPAAPLPLGPVTITATQVIDGISTADSVAFTVPEAPVAITAPAPGSTVTSQQPAIAGTGTPGAIVTLTDQSGNLIGQATVAADGTWTFAPAAPLSLGPVTVTATQAINGADTTTDSVSFTVTGA